MRLKWVVLFSIFIVWVIQLSLEDAMVIFIMHTEYYPLKTSRVLSGLKFVGKLMVCVIGEIVEGEDQNPMNHADHVGKITNS